MGLGGMWLRIAGAFMKIVILTLNEVEGPAFSLLPLKFTPTDKK
jgi:hypothetical protein